MNKKAVAPTQPNLSRSLRRYLYLTAAFTGAAIMVVEVLGAKMLSPYIGLSHFVWTAQIAVTLVALACGYYTGGRLADRSPKLNWLYWAICSAAVFLALTVLLCEPVAYWCLDFNLAVGSFLASTILFFIPLALLAMTGPFLIRVITSSVSGVGGNVGRLTSISTLGSFIGTLLIGYILIPLLPNSITMYVTALALLLVCGGYFAVWRRSAIAPLLLLYMGMALIAFRYKQISVHPYQFVTERFFGNSHFGQLQVIDSSRCRYYLNDFLTQNTYDTSRKQSMSQFTYLLAGLARIYTTNTSDVLCIGMGVGIVPMDFAHQGANVDVVEINPAVVPVAKRYFDFEPEKVHLTLDDGRHFLNRCQKQYDAVILDAFLGDSSPSHLLTKQAFAAVHRVLRPGGVIVINAFGQSEPGHDFFGASLTRTLAVVFRSVKIHSNGDGGFFYVATDRDPITPLHPPNLDAVHPAIRSEAKASYEGTVTTDPAHGRVLTDDYNPVEFYDAHNREELRKRLAINAREM